MVGLVVAITFLSNAYRFYLPCMVGLAISLSTIAKQYMATNPPDPDPQAFNPHMLAAQPMAAR